MIRTRACDTHTAMELQDPDDQRRVTIRDALVVRMPRVGLLHESSGQLHSAVSQTFRCDRSRRAGAEEHHHRKDGCESAHSHTYGIVARERLSSLCGENENYATRESRKAEACRIKMHALIQGVGRTTSPQRIQ